MRRVVLTLLLVPATVFAGTVDEARQLLESRQYQEARRLLEPALGNPATEAEAAVLLTRVCNELGEYEEGVEHGKRAVELLPDSSEAHYQYAVALRIKASAVNKLKAMFVVSTYKEVLGRAIELDPHNSDARAEWIGFLINAPGMAGGDRDEAEQKIAELAKIDWLAAQKMQVALESVREDTAAAIRVSQRILERYPDDSDVRSTLGYLLQQEERFPEADEQFALARQSEDRLTSLGALYQRGRTRILGGYELEEAIGFLQAYIEKLTRDDSQLPSRAAAHWRIGMAQEKMQRLAAARSSYQRALELEPDFKEAKVALKALR